MASVDSLTFSPLDLQIDDDHLAPRRMWVWAAAGVTLSLLFHAWLAATLSTWLIDGTTLFLPEPIESRFHHPEETPVEKIEVVVYELANPDDRELDQQVALNALSIGMEATRKPTPEMEPVPLQELDPSRQSRPVYDIPMGIKVSDRLVVPGTTGESIIQLEAALDRITWEIAGHLQERKVLVVWLLDASQSLAPQRQTVQQRLQRVYKELDALTEAEQIPRRERGLLSAVVAFGQSTTFLTTDPTSKFAEISDAFSSVQNDPSGVENVFTAVSQVMDRWAKYRTQEGRRILIVTITDEAGDDHGQPLDQAIAKCRRYGAMAYVIGPAAPFGKRRGYVPYIAPEDSRTYQLPVDLGPESVVVENVELPFWYNGPQFANLSSGFGPYALSRLVHETGGVYFVTNMTTMAGLATVGSYDPQLMKAFEPDYRYGSPQEFLSEMARYPMRAAVFAAAQHSQTTSLKAAGTPKLFFELTPRNFRTEFSEAQKSAAISQLAIDSILAQMPPNAESARETDPSLRWRLAFDLNYGRLLAHKVRATEYNAALAQLKGTYTDADIANRVNRIALRPDRNVNYAGGMQKLARKAEEYLRRVESEAPGTPWAILAGRELRDGFGIQVVESYIAPPPPRPPGPPATPKARPRFAPEPPGPPPKPPAPQPPPALPKL